MWWCKMEELKKILEDKGYTKEQFEGMEDCPYSHDAEEKINWNEFLRGIKEQDFSVGDMFWLNGVEFEVKQVE